MEVRHLRYFLAVAEELHFGRAAQRLHMAQPPLSARIAGLERELGTPLFERTSRRVELTAAGEHLLPHAREAVASFERARGALTDAGLVEPAVLRVGLPPETAPEVMSAIQDGLRLSHPTVSVQFREAFTAEQLSLLARGELDVALVRHPLADRQLTVPWVLRRRLGVVLDRRHRLAGRGELCLADLDGQTLVLFPREGSPGLYDDMLHTCRAHGYAPQQVEHALRLVEGVLAGRDAVSLDAARSVDARPSLVWRPLAEDPLSWRTSLVWHANTTTALKHRVARLTSVALKRWEDWQPTNDDHTDPNPSR